MIEGPLSQNERWGTLRIYAYIGPLRFAIEIIKN